MADYNSDRTGSNIDLTLDKVDALDAKVQPTATGANVTGTLTADGLTSDGGIVSTGSFATVQARKNGGDTFGAGATLGLANAAANRIWFNQLSLSNNYDYWYFDGATPRKRATIANNGDVSFYEDTGTTAKMVWSSSTERLGIGTATPSSQVDIYSSSSHANINVETTTGSSYSATYIAKSNGGRAESMYYNGVSNYWNVGVDSDGKYKITNNANGNMGTNQRFVIDSAGNVGIGTASPTEKLHVDGKILAKDTLDINWAGVDSETRGNLTVQYAASGGVDRGASLAFINDANLYSSRNPFTSSVIKSAKSNNNNNERASNLEFYTHSNTSLNKAMTIDSAGNVGIGTASPNFIASTYSGITINNTDGSFVDLEQGGTLTGRIAANSSGVDIHSKTVSPIKFWINDTERARIDSSGNLLVGKTSPGIANLGIELHSSDYIASTANGQAAAYFTRATNDGSILILRKDGTTVGSIGSYLGSYLVAGSSGNSNDTYLAFANGTIKPATSAGDNRDANTNLGQSNSRFKDLYLSGGVITSSDYRLKEDVQPMQSYADTIKQMNLVNFAWKDSGKREDGFIAHELQALVPSAVRGDKDAIDEDGNERYQGVDPLKLIPVLTKALQEALERIETLENK